jgi:hypothetical protein
LPVTWPDLSYRLADIDECSGVVPLFCPSPTI